ncbi:DMT family transporter [Cellulomonas sp. KRMCY2]|uniref:DMT family transporter n=1 Tax=Cellulomonas sp. KRMCY2 TaxID=1304865 RepID=UPI00045EC1C1|nr:DMT family transporter [Cellulomonas sp. KRMCY2]
MTSTRRAGLLLALTTAAISGVAIFLNGYGVRAFGNASAYTTAKNLVAAVVLLAVVALGGRAGARLTRPTGARQWLVLLVIGVVGGSVPFLLFFEGLARASSAQSAFIHKTLVVWVAALAVPLLGEKLSGAHGVAIALLVGGQIGLVGGVTTSLGSGEMMIVAATLLWSVEVVLAKKMLAGMSSWTVGVARLGIGSVVLVAWAIVRGQAGLLVSMDSAQWGWVLLTGVILAAYVGTWFAALARAQAVDVTAVLVLAALVTAALSAAVDGVAPGPQLGWLAMLVAGGGLLAWRTWHPADVVPGAAAA